jgi:hypothetical protein
MHVHHHNSSRVPPLGTMSHALAASLVEKAPLPDDPCQHGINTALVCKATKNPSCALSGQQYM